VSLSITNISPSTLQDGDTVTLTGSGFGSSQGSVLIGGLSQAVSAWSDTGITFTASKGSQSLGACRVDVVAGVSSGYTPTVIVTDQTGLNRELEKNADQLEGQVIGVQYNATPYTIGQSQLQNKNFGTGGLVITQYGETMPVFSAIVTDDTVRVVFDRLEVSRPDGTGNGCFHLRDGTHNITIQNCVLHGKYYDPNGDYSAGGYNNINGITFSQGAGTQLRDIKILNNTFYDINRGSNSLVVGGSLEVIGNTYYNTYEDAHGIRYVSGVVPKINWNLAHSPIALATDSGSPHTDFIQFVSASETGTWEVEVLGNIVITGNSRGQTQGIVYFKSDPAPALTGKIAGNLVISSTSHGISIEDADSLTVIGNTVVSADPDGAFNTSAIRVGNENSYGTHVIKNNVTHTYVIGGTPTSVNNYTVTKSSSAYAAIFDGADFDRTDITNKATALAAYAMKVGGALDTTTNIGAVGSGYVDYTARTLNTAMEA
jgi:hypothetical protein